MGNKKAGKTRKQKQKARQLKKRSFRTTVLRASYNMVLYKARQEAGQGRFGFARSLKIFPLLYPLIECGYIRPGKKMRAKISAYLGEDYEPYCEGISSYPEDLPEKESLKIVKWFYRLLGSTPLRIFFVLLIIASLGLLSYGLMKSDDLADNEKDYYPNELHALRDGILEEGTPTLFFDPDSPMDLNLVYSEIYHREKDLFISVRTDQAPDAYNKLEFVMRIWTPEGRLNYRRTPADGDGLIVSFTDYESNTIYTGEYISLPDGSYEPLTISDGGYRDMDPERKTELEALFATHLEEFDEAINGLILDKLGLVVDSASLSQDTGDIWDALTEASVDYTAAVIVGAVSGLIFLYFLVYSLLYGTRTGIPRQLPTGTNLIRYARRSEPKTDILPTPFLPETLLYLVGSALLLYSSLRFIYLAISFSFSFFLDMDTALAANRSMTQLFYVAMFLLYFLDFDSFLDDKRVQGKIFMYFLFYVALYVAETALITEFTESPSAVYQMIAQIQLPNVFGSVCCYFIIMHFLFFTPPRIKKKGQLVRYRLCSLIPVILIFASKLIFNGGEKYFGWNLPIAVKYLFSGERVTFSLLCIGYLYGLYFLRLTFEKRYGTDNARKYFNGNRFIWQKNILTCLLVLLIAFISWLLKDNPVAATFGIGESQELLILVPLLLFYHPHKGPRNRLVDALTMVVYVVALCFGYVVAGLIFLMGVLVI